MKCRDKTQHQADHWQEIQTSVRWLGTKSVEGALFFPTEAIYEREIESIENRCYV